MSIRAWCVAACIAGAGLSTASAVAAEQPPQSIWQRDDLGVAHHLQSAMRCPQMAADFSRTAFGAFDGFGFDVVCQYDLGDSRITVYMTRIPDGAMADYLSGSIGAVSEATPGLTPLDTAAMALPEAEAPWQYALFEMPDGLRRTGIWIRDMSGWGFKIRATYPAALEQAALDAIAVLNEEVAATAGPHLAACAASPPPPRGAQRITDAETLNSIAAVAGVEFTLMSALPADIFGLGPGPETWCVEEPAVIEGRGLLFWRNIAGDGMAGAVDRVTLTTLDMSPVLELAVDPAATRAASGGGEDPGTTVHRLSVRNGDIVDIYGFFDGRPDWATLSAFIDGVVTNVNLPLVSVDTANGSINLSVPE